MFSQACIIPSVHGGGGGHVWPRGHAWQKAGMHGKRGVRGKGGHVW